MGLKKKKTFAFIKNRLQNRLKNRQIYLLSQCIILHMDIDWKSIIINKERLLWLTGNRIQLLFLQETDWITKEDQENNRKFL